MNSKSVNYLLTATTLFSSGSFFSSIPAEAHSFDYCIDILQEEAEKSVTGTSKRKLEQKAPKEYQEFAQDCEQELKEQGFITPSQAKENKNLANFVRDGVVTLESLDPVKVQKQQDELKQSEARLNQTRQQICAQNDPATDYACRPKIEQQKEQQQKEQLKEQQEKQKEVNPQSATPQANNVLVAAVPQVGDMLSQGALKILKPMSPLVSLITGNGGDRTRDTSSSLVSADLVAQAGPSLVGEWEPVFGWPLVAVHMAVLPPDGQVLAWTRPKFVEKPAPRYTLWNPNNGQFSPVKNDTVTDIFCAGHDFAPSGNLLLAGGHEGGVKFDPNQPPGDGSPDINVFNFSNKKWTRFDDAMKHLDPKTPVGRWYPTVTYNGKGEGVIVGGSIVNEDDSLNQFPEVWGRNGVAGTTTLSGASSASFVHNSGPKQYKGLPVKPYLWNFLAPSGRILNVGPLQATRVLNTDGTGSWLKPLANTTISDRYYGTAVMYDGDKGRVILIGGSQEFYSVPTNASETIDLSVSPLKWIGTTNAMAFPRRHHTATLLADGTVFVAGGTTCGGFNQTNKGCGKQKGGNKTGAVFPGEIWDPDTSLWRTVASMNNTIKRTYHTTAVLLPDATVLVAGGGLPAGNSKDVQGNFNAQIYKPPYLFNGARPVIKSAPTGVFYGKPFIVQTPEAASIKNVHWIRLSSMTHQFNVGQRINRSNFSQVPGGLSVTVPNNKNLTPPGYYMLFILNGQDVPSVAKIIKIS